MYRYVPADARDWVVLASGDLALVVETPADADDLDRYWSAVSGGDIRAVLDVLASRGVSATPAFAVVDWEQGSALRCMVRGVCTVSIELSAGPALELDGGGASTWFEHTVENATGFAVGTGSESSGATLPLGSGIVRGSSLASAVGLTAPARPAAPAVSVPVAEATVSGETIAESVARPTAYDHLFDETIVRSVADAAVTPHADEPEDEAVEPQAPAGDHDGETVLIDSVATLLAGRKKSTTPPPSVPASPTLYLELSTGEREPLTQPVILGRAPSVSKVSGANVPRLVTITGDDDISRNHVQFVVEGDTVVVTDLHSRNGTTIVLPGKSPQQLRRGEPTSILVGTLVDLGGGTTITVGED